MNRWLMTGLSVGMLCFLPETVQADDLFKDSSWSNLATDLKASEVGDVLLVYVIESAEASHFSRQTRRKSTSISGDANIPGVSEISDIGIGRRFEGTGDVRRGESLLTHLSVIITEVLSNGNYVIEGEQTLKINQEETKIRVRGIVRPQDIYGDNTIYSHRIANAQIQYDGSGFVTRGSRPGLFDKIFNFLGLI